MRDVLIIGAGPAGSLAACLLARRGWDVSLVEQHRFPRDKVCGESLSALGIEVLHRAGVAETIRSMRPARLTRTALHSMDGSSLWLSLPREMWGISRRRMDGALLDAAVASGARLIQPARCESIEDGAQIRHLDANRLQVLRPAVILLADGKGALLPRQRGRTSDLGIKAHFENVDGPADTVELFGASGHYLGLACIEDSLVNVAMSLPAAKLAKSGGSIDAAWGQVLRENVALAARFARARRMGGWLASPLPRFSVSRNWPADVIPIGNAAAALEPIGGEGMGLALRSAELAVEMLCNSDRPASPHVARRLQREFGALWQARSLACRIVARLLSSPSVASPLIEWAACNPLLARMGLAWIGKG